MKMFNSFYKFRFTTTSKWLYSFGWEIDFIDVFIAHDSRTYIIKQRMPANKFVSNILRKKRL